jgi:hypothetical protein
MIDRHLPPQNVHSRNSVQCERKVIKKLKEMWEGYCRWETEMGMGKKERFSLTQGIFYSLSTVHLYNVLVRILTVEIKIKDLY